jgi:hypothetical protein
MDDSPREDAGIGLVVGDRACTKRNERSEQIMATNASRMMPLWEMLGIGVSGHTLRLRCRYPNDREGNDATTSCGVGDRGWGVVAPVTRLASMGCIPVLSLSCHLLELRVQLSKAIFRSPMRALTLKNCTSPGPR